MSTTAAEPPAPLPTPETAPYWEAARQDRLALQCCPDCGWVGLRGRSVCPGCTGTGLEWFTASGRATLLSYVIVHRAEPAFADRAPYAVAIVQLAEGPRMTTSVVGVEQTPEALRLDMPLVVRFEPRGDQAVPVFAPAPDEPEEGLR